MTQSKKILLVEEEAIATYIASNILEELKFKFDVADAGEKAIALAKKCNYALIFMDLGLPDKDGFEVTREIRKDSLNSDTPIVAITANDDQERRNQAEKVGMDDFLAKPFTIDKAKYVIKK